MISATIQVKTSGHEEAARLPQLHRIRDSSQTGPVQYDGVIVGWPSCVVGKPMSASIRFKSLNAASGEESAILNLIWEGPLPIVGELSLLPKGPPLPANPLEYSAFSGIYQYPLLLPRSVKENSELVQ